jgi:hypothetical protein
MQDDGVGMYEPARHKEHVSVVPEPDDAKLKAQMQVDGVDGVVPALDAELAGQGAQALVAELK